MSDIQISIEKLSVVPGRFLLKRVFFISLVLLIAFVGPVSGATWSRVGNNNTESPDGYVCSLLSANGILYAGYCDNDIPLWDMRGGGVWEWNGTSWSEVGGHPGSFFGVTNVQTLTNFGKTVYAGTLWYGVWAWDGISWHPINFGMMVSGKYIVPTSCLISSNGTLYAGTSGEGVWAWDGSIWFPVGGNFTRNYVDVTDLIRTDGTIYAGTFGEGVWAWNGTSWSQVGGPSGLTGDAATIYSIISLNGTLYAGTWGGVWAWDGISWSQVGSSTWLTGSEIRGNQRYARNLINSGGILYASAQNGVWAWNGTSWFQVVSLSGLTSDYKGYTSISSLLISEGTLYAGTSNGVWKIPLSPIITNVSPASGPITGGTTVTISGSGFTGATDVYFGTIDVPCTQFTSISDSQIVISSPPGSAGAVNVTVKTPIGTGYTSSADRFTYTSTTALTSGPLSLTQSGNIPLAVYVALIIIGLLAVRSRH